MVIEMSDPFSNHKERMDNVLICSCYGSWCSRPDKPPQLQDCDQPTYSQFSGLIGRQKHPMVAALVILSVIDVVRCLVRHRFNLQHQDYSKDRAVRVRHVESVFRQVRSIPEAVQLYHMEPKYCLLLYTLV